MAKATAHFIGSFIIMLLMVAVLPIAVIAALKSESSVKSALELVNDIIFII